jgi:flagellar hook-associated protein 3 FlgL
MIVKGIANPVGMSVQAAVDMRNQLVDLQRQLSTGKRSDTYSGLGLDRGLTVGLRAHLSAIDGYQDTITQTSVRLSLAQTALSQIVSVGQGVKTTALVSQFKLSGGTQTADQQSAMIQLDQVLGLLNTTTGGRYLFSGRAVDKAAVDTSDHILNGDGVRAGLKQVINERRLADLGASGLGRLVLSAPNATSVAVTEDAVSPFGFKLASISGNLTGATFTGPAGAPPSVGVDLGATNPNAGESIRVSLNLPDGSKRDVTLTATNAMPAGPNEFTIGANSTVTAGNLQAALSQTLGALAGSELAAASAIAAGNDFFNTDASNPPKRVGGPPFASATALVNGTPANTVGWYTGDNGTDPARSTAVARADQSLVLSYGMRANETALRRTLQSIAVFAATSYSTTDPNAEASYAALRQRLASDLEGPPNQQKLSDIQGELAGVQNALATSKTRHTQTKSTLQGLLDQVEGISNEQVAAEILSLQTTLQASLQTSAILLQTNLLKFL